MNPKNCTYVVFIYSLRIEYVYFIFQLHCDATYNDKFDCMHMCFASKKERKKNIYTFYVNY